MFKSAEKREIASLEAKFALDPTVEPCPEFNSTAIEPETGLHMRYKLFELLGKLSGTAHMRIEFNALPGGEPHISNPWNMMLDPKKAKAFFKPQRYVNGEQHNALLHLDGHAARLMEGTQGAFMYGYLWFLITQEIKRKRFNLTRPFILQNSFLAIRQESAIYEYEKRAEGEFPVLCEPIPSLVKSLVTPSFPRNTGQVTQNLMWLVNERLFQAGLGHAISHMQQTGELAAANRDSQL